MLDFLASGQMNCTSIQRPIHSKVLTELAIFPNYRSSWMLCIVLPTRQKLKLPKNYFNKKFASKILFSIKKN
jgi:hypothetical protein